MVFAILNERDTGETRVALVPAQVSRWVELGTVVRVEAGCGLASGHADAAYLQAGASVATDRHGLLPEADLILRVGPPRATEVVRMKPGAVHVSLLDPFQNRECLLQLAARGVSAVSLELVPRITRAQRMDVLSSQASLAGYVGMILAADRLPKIFPLMMTAAGTLNPARVLVLGAGVAGLQAIATAHRLGAVVQAYDTRPAAEQEVRSLGARFVKLDLGETGQTAEGYARALTDEQLARQRQGLRRFCAEADVILTAAQVFGGRAPVLLTAELLRLVPPGGVVVDLAVETGGNVEGVVPGQEIVRDGVTLVGLTHLPRRVPVHASLAFSNNVAAWLEAFWNKTSRRLELNLEDEILRNCLVTHGGRIVHPRFQPTA